MVINSNNAATNAKKAISSIWNRLEVSTSRLSKGSKIIEPKDDAAGIAVASKQKSEKSINDKVINNLKNSASFIQAQSGYLKTIESALKRMSELAMLAMDKTKSDEDRILYDKEFENLKTFINQTAGKTFNGINLFQGNNFEIIDNGSELSWHEARDDAIARGGYLATITNSQNNDIIVNLIGQESIEHLWIGATDENSEGEWKWVTGEAVQYSDWGLGEPNGGVHENYAVFGWGGSKEWNDTSNRASISKYIIEYNSEIEITYDSDGNTFTHPGIKINSVEDSINSYSNAKTALGNLNSYIQDTARSAGIVGSSIGRIDKELSQLNEVNINLNSSVSRIYDLNIAEESTRLAKEKILSTSAVNALKKAYNIPKNLVRQLLGIN